MNSNDLANVMGSFIETELNSFEELNKELEEKDKEIKRLNNIIKEVREYIGISEEDKKIYDIYDVNGIEILEILNKENK